MLQLNSASAFSAKLFCSRTAFAFRAKAESSASYGDQRFGQSFARKSGHCHVRDHQIEPVRIGFEGIQRIDAAHPDGYLISEPLENLFFELCNRRFVVSDVF